MIEKLIHESKVDEAIDALAAHLRDNPGDAKARISLFELLCASGEYDRAEKHLAILAQGTKDTLAGSLLYYGALHAERLRREMFEKETFPAPLDESAGRIAGSINGKPFESLSDSDPRIGARLEVFAAGDYLWIPFRHIRSIEMEPPKRLRDLMWAPAVLKTGPDFGDRELGEVLLPALTPLTFLHPDGAVRLGRVTEWCADERGREYPYGQKMLLAGGEETPFLEVRRVEIAAGPAN